MLEPQSTSLAISIAGFASIAVAATPHVINGLRTHLSGKRPYQSLSDLYEDEDGAATEKSQESFSDLPQRLILVIASLTGAIIALVSAVWTQTNEATATKRDLTLQQWLQFASWAIVLAQSLNIYVTASSLQRCKLGAWNLLSCLALAAAVAAEDLVLYFTESYPEPLLIHAIFSIAEFVIAVLLMVTSVTFPRRPELFLNGKVVDREGTVSLLNRFTFSWPAPVLAWAAKNQTLTHDDLPVVNYSMRARTLRARFDAVGKKDKLWKQIFWSHSHTFIAQWLLQVVSAFTNFLPQIVLYTVLKLLEARDAGASNQFELWLAAIALGLGVAVGAWLESLLFYTCFLKLGIPVYEQLSAVIFAKALRKKDVKSAAKVDQDAEIRGEIGVTKDSALQNEETAIATDEDPADDDEEVTKTKQSTINLIGVDGKRVSDFCTYNYLFLGSAMKLIIAIAFLTKLIGWIPMLCGFAGPFVLSPINYLISKNYSDAQDQLMKYRDQKMGVITEALQGCRQIKLMALEREWYEKIMKTRRKELKEQMRIFYLDTGLISIWIFGPACMSAISLSAYAYINGTLSASVAFTALSVFESIEMTLAILPEMATEMIDAIVSSRRIQQYLDSAELAKATSVGDCIAFKDAAVAWPSDEDSPEDRKFTLEDLNIQFVSGELNIISGKTGSGKSLLLSAIIGEADLLKGELTMPAPPKEEERFDHKANKSNWIIKESVAYVSQIPWIENASLRDNILFGLPYDEDRYKKVVSASALEKDLHMLQDGDMTDIGANGINLSGGQKWRTSFARSLYSRAGILVMDDIFSAVDAHVGRQLYENALTGELCKGRTRILVTHHVSLCLPKTKYIVLLEDGRALRAGMVDDLRASGHLNEILAQDIEELTTRKEDATSKDEPLLIDDGGYSLTQVHTNQSRRSRRTSSQSQIDHSVIQRETSRLSGISETKSKTQQREPPKKFTEDETRNVGSMGLSLYKKYIQACRGAHYWMFLVAVFLLWIVVYLGRSLWVSRWARQYKTEDNSPAYLSFQTSSWRQTVRSKFDGVRASKQQDDIIYYIAVYISISLAAWLIGTVRYFCVYLASIRGSRVLFEGLLHTILRAPLRFLDTTPLGRITNRCTADFNMIDSRMAGDLGFMFHCIISVISVIIAGLFVSPFMLLFAVFLLASSGWYARQFVRGAREVKRLESNAKSPIFEQFGSVLTGIATVRSFERSGAYIERMFEKINTHATCYWHVYLFSRWMSFRANMVGATFTLATAALIVSLPSIDGPLAGFVLSFTLDLSESVIWALRQYANVELNFNAVERVLEYSSMETEKQDGENPPAAWPTRGGIEVEDLVVSYAPDLPPVLKNVTFTVQPNERVGVVGRTGAGKSSLTLALFRFIEATSGKLSIDGLDIAKIKLHDLRSRLAIIPQDPVLFSGTVRSNLDPFDQHTDAELRDALARVHLLDPAAAASAQASGSATPVARARSEMLSSPSGTSTPVNKNTALSLSTRISESGGNLSAGQKQLLCLARALVSRPRILILDEATSSVDMETDALIQKSLREEFGGKSTLIVIAHRLSTIADFDRVLVLGGGEVIEYGTPRELYEKSEAKDGSFKEMVLQSGEKAVLEQVMFGRSKK